MWKKLIIVLFALLTGCYQSTHVPGDSISWCAKTYMENHANQQLHFPINVYISSDMRAQDQEATIFAAVTWNDVMNAAIFVPIVTDRPMSRETCGTAWISIHHLPKNYVGYTWWDSCSAECQLEPNQDLKKATHIMIHELGHVLNLHHETSENSIMYEYVGQDQHISDLSECLVEQALREADAY